MNDRKAMQQALEALEMLSQQPIEMALDYADNAIDVLRDRLAQPEQDDNCKHCTDGCPACDAALVAAAEREACAKLAEELHPGLSSTRVAEVIRARGNT